MNKKVIAGIATGLAIGMGGMVVGASVANAATAEQHAAEMAYVGRVSTVSNVVYQTEMTPEEILEAGYKIADEIVTTGDVEAVSAAVYDADQGHDMTWAENVVWTAGSAVLNPDVVPHVKNYITVSLTDFAEGVEEPVPADLEQQVSDKVDEALAPYMA